MVLTKTPSKYATSKIIITDYLLRKNTNYNIHYAGEKSVFPVDTRRRFNIDTTSCDAVRRRTDVSTTSFFYWAIGYWFKSAYVKEVISPIQNFVVKPKRPLKIKNIFLVLYLQRVDLRVSLKLSEKKVSYLFTRILAIMRSHICNHITLMVFNYFWWNFI